MIHGKNKPIAFAPPPEQRPSVRRQFALIQKKIDECEIEANVCYRGISIMEMTIEELRLLAAWLGDKYIRDKAI